MGSGDGCHGVDHDADEGSGGEWREQPESQAESLPVVQENDGIDLVAAERAAGQFLQALGISTASESLHGTPGRMARAYAELFSPRPFDLTTFPNDEGYDELVLARSIPVRSVCEHHSPDVA